MTARSARSASCSSASTAWSRPTAVARRAAPPAAHRRRPRHRADTRPGSVTPTGSRSCGAAWAGGSADVWYCAPVGERGAAFRLRYRNLGTPRPRVELGWAATWASSSVAHLRSSRCTASSPSATIPWTGSRVAALMRAAGAAACCAHRRSSGAGTGSARAHYRRPAAAPSLAGEQTADVPPGGELDRRRLPGGRARAGWRGRDRAAPAAARLRRAAATPLSAG